MSAVRRTIALALAGMIALSAGCGSGPEPESEPSELAAPITISRGGGIAGTLYETTIEPDGTGVFDEREAFGPKVEPESFQASDAQLEKLGEIADATPFDEIGEAIEPACADCYVYEITYGDQRLVVDSATISQGEPGEPAVDLIEALSRVGPNPDSD